MKKIILVLVSGLLFCSTAFSGTAFKCENEKSRFEIVAGYYAGEGSDAVILKSSSVYSIYNRDNYGEPLSLKRESDQVRTRGLLKDFPLQYVAKQKNDLGSKTSVFAVELGTFGGSVGKAFEAALVTDQAYLMHCEIVSEVNLRD